MYYLYNSDSEGNSLIDEYEDIEGARSAKSMFPGSILLYHDNAKDAWEHGIEIDPEGQAPETSKEFVYFIEYLDRHTNEWGGIEKTSQHSFSVSSLEQALENLKNMIENHYEDRTVRYWIEERQTTTHKVKI